MVDRKKTIADAEAKAREDGKEPFDYTVLNRLCRNANLHYRSVDDCRYEYYVMHPELRTMAAYAQHLEEIAPWEDSN